MEENAFKVTLNVNVCVQSPVLYQSCCGSNNIQPLGGATDHARAHANTHSHDAACALVCVRRVSH